MSTDRELLEMAAKAAGIVGKWSRIHQTYGDQWVDGLDTGGPIFWNALVDDGDALRLMAKLRLDVCRPYKQHAEVCVWVDHLRDYLEEPEGDDPAAATRRAIVRAAAAIGEALP